MHFRTCVAALCVLIASTILHAAEEESAAESKRVEGRFERSITNAAGTVFRVVKEERDGHSTVTMYDDVGNVVEAHQSQYKIEKRGPVRVFSFFNLVVTAGPNKGHVDPATNSYIYRVDDDAFTEAWGLLEGDPNPPRMFVWKRVK